MSLRKSIHAVLTGDIVNSTQLDPSIEKTLLKELRRVLEPYTYEFYRGDSFQAFIKEPAKSLQVALICRTLAISLTAGEGELSVSDVRISIGIGEVIHPVKAPGTAKGEAFLLSGRLFDDMQGSEQRLAIAAENPIAVVGLQVIASYIDTIYRGMTAKQADAILGLLRGDTQQEVAMRLNKSKSTVSQLVNAGRWQETENLLRQYELLINQLA
ncbi:MAG TPA: hypothetical protein VGM31_08080 [Puia sp.]|jgi:hypothetical protein